MSQKTRKFVAWRLRLKNGVSSASAGDLNGAVEWLERAEVVFGAVVFFGIALEVLVAWVNPAFGTSLERWGPVIADGFVGLGVLGEVVASARMTLLSGELTRRSNDRLGKAEKEAAEARERAAEIERATAWRHVTPELREAVARALEGKASLVKLSVEFQMSDPEALAYSRELIEAFRQAGVRDPIAWQANSFIAGFIFGLNLWAHPDMELEELYREMAQHVPVTGLARPSTASQEHRDNVYVFVGTKTPELPGIGRSPSPPNGTA